jgi:hypothetical protein
MEKAAVAAILLLMLAAQIFSNGVDRDHDDGKANNEKKEVEKQEVTKPTQSRSKWAVTNKDQWWMPFQKCFAVVKFCCPKVLILWARSMVTF